MVIDWMKSLRARIGSSLYSVAEWFGNNVIRMPLWVLVGAAACCLLVLSDVSSQLESIHDGPSRAYSADVFTGPQIDITNTSSLSEALELWLSVSDTASAKLLLNTHIWVDVVFIFFYGALLYRTLNRVGGRTERAVRVAGRISLMVMAADLAETLWMLWVVSMSPASSEALILARALSLVKWVAVLVALLSLFVLWRRPGGPSPDSALAAARRAYRGGPRPLPISLLGLIVLIALFFLLVALPSGGPFEQLPDVLRFQFESPGWPAIWSTVALMALAGCIVVASSWATTPPRETDKDRTSSLWILGGSLAMTAGVSQVGIFRGGFSDPIVVFAPLIVVGVVWLARGIVYVVTRSRRSDAAATPVQELQHSLRATKEYLDELAAMAELNSPESTPTATRTRWMSGLGGSVVVIGGLGLVRAAVPPVLFFDDKLRWILLLAAGVLTASVGGWLLQSTLTKAMGSGGRLPILLRGFSIGFVAIMAIALSVEPRSANAIGTNGVVATAFGCLALIVGAASWLTGSRPPWKVTVDLGLGSRTPWMSLLVALWIVASVLNTNGGYHDVRLSSDGGVYVHEHMSLRTAFDDWVMAQETAPQCGNDGPIPMVLVAAPGGGIRAAYWTGLGLDELFSQARSECASRRVFAISGVSGGSVGTGVWAASGESSPQPALSVMARDEGLAAAIAGLFFRDLPASFTGARDPWADRAEVLEEIWVERSGVFGSLASERTWSFVADHRPWEPVLVLNGSSVNDGCRILVTNTGGLPASNSGDCFDVSATSGPASGTIDPIASLEEPCADKTCARTGAQLPALTAMYLSARYPVVAPSGALHYGVKNEEEQFTTFVVDGGYYENSLFTLLQIWSELQPMVEDFNDCDSCSGIQPWIVVLDNHYRTEATVDKEPDRPPEFLAILRALGSDLTFGQAALEQMAAFAIDMNMKPSGDARLVVIAPQQRPAVSAPLGWVLSNASMCDLHAQLLDQLHEGKVKRLLIALGNREPIRTPPSACSR